MSLPRMGHSKDAKGLPLGPTGATWVRKGTGTIAELKIEPSFSQFLEHLPAPHSVVRQHTRTARRRTNRHTSCRQKLREVAREKKKEMHSADPIHVCQGWARAVFCKIFVYQVINVFV